MTVYLRLTILGLALPLAAVAGEADPPRADEDRRVVLLPLRSSGRIDDIGRDDLLQGVLSGVNRLRSPVEPRQLAAAQQKLPRLKGCYDDDCLLAVARETHARAVLLGDVSRQEAPPAPPKAKGRKRALPAEEPLPSYHLRLRLFDTAICEVVSDQEADCAGCTEVTVRDRIAELAQQLFERARTTPGVEVDVQSTPPGDRVRVDGRVLGATPLRLGLAVGSHQVVVERPGGGSARSTVALVAGPGVRLVANFDGEPQLRQERTAAAPPPEEPRPIDGPTRLIPVPEQAPPATAAKVVKGEPPKTEPPKRRGWLWGVIAAVGVVVVAGAVVTGVAATTPRNANVPSTDLGDARIRF